MDPQLRALLNNSVQIAVAGAQDEHGRITYGAPAARACRLQGRFEQIRNAQGVEVASAQQVFLEGDVGERDRVWLPGEDPNADPGREPIAVSRRYAPDGTLDHVKLFLGAVQGVS